MKEFRFLEYYTKYSYSGDIEKNNYETREYCFKEAFKYIEDNYNIEYKIYMYKGTGISIENRYNNACLVDKYKIKRHINLLKSLYPINCKVVEHDDFFDVFIHINKAPVLFHKYALTWARYLYEFPYNVLLLDAYKLKNISTFRFESIVNLFNLTIGCYCSEPRELHCLVENEFSNRRNIKYLKDQLKKSEKLHELFGHHADKDEEYKIELTFNEYNTSDIEFWNSEENFNNRKKIYLKAYEDLYSRNSK